MNAENMRLARFAGRVAMSAVGWLLVYLGAAGLVAVAQQPGAEPGVAAIQLAAYLGLTSVMATACLVVACGAGEEKR